MTIRVVPAEEFTAREPFAIVYCPRLPLDRMELGLSLEEWCNLEHVADLLAAVRPGASRAYLELEAWRYGVEVFRYPMPGTLRHTVARFRERVLFALRNVRELLELGLQGTGPR